MIPLEDNYLEILKKASIGQGLGEKIVELSQLPASRIKDFLMVITANLPLKLFQKF